MDRKLINEFLHARDITHLRVKGGRVTPIENCPYRQVKAVMWKIINKRKQKRRQHTFNF